MGFSLFFANKRYHPYLYIHLEQALLSDMAHQYSTKLEKIHTQLKSSITDA